MRKCDRSVVYVNCGVLPNFYFGFTTSEKAFDREMKRLNIENAPRFNGIGYAVTHTFTSGSDGTTCIVTLDPKEFKGRTIAQLGAVVAHEAVHVWQRAEESMRERQSGVEMPAYGVQFFTQFMLGELGYNKPIRR